MTTNTYSFGDIVSADIIFSDHSDAKIRPILILNKDRQDYLFLKLTGNTNNQTAHDLIFTPNDENGLRATTVARIGSMHTYHQSILRKKVGTLTKKEKNHLKQKLHLFIDNI